MNTRGRVALMLSIGLLIIVGIVIAGSSLEEALVEVEPEVVDEVQVDPEPAHVDDIIDEADVIKEPFVAGPLVEFEPTNTSEMGVLTNTHLLMTHFEKVSIDDISKNLSFEPAIDFEVVQLDDLSYEISFNELLERGTLVKAKYTYENTLYGDSFLTMPNLEVASVYPSDGSYEAKTNTIVEIKFNLPIDENIKEYFSISPAVPGELKISENILRFVPKNDLETNIYYEVSILPGYEKEGSVLESSSFSFSVSDRNSIYVNFGDGNYNVLSADGVQQISYYGDKSIKSKLDKFSVYAIDQQVTEIMAMESVSAIVNQLTEEGNGRYLQDIGVSFESGQYYGGYIILEENLDKGIYYFVADLGSEQKGFFAQVTEKCAYFTADKNEVLVWLADSAGGSLDGQVRIDGQLIGSLGSDGFNVFDYEMVQEKKAIVEIETPDEILYMPMEVRKSNDSLRYQFYSYLDTDREIYRESDTIRVNGFLKDRRGYSTDKVEIRFWVGGAVIETKEASVDAYGLFQTSFDFEEVKHNEGMIQVYVGDEFLMSEYCYISNFEKPKYVMDTSLDKKNIASGDQITFRGKLSYYDGTPVAGASINVEFNQRSIKFKHEDKSVGQLKLYSDNGLMEAELTAHYESTNWRPTYAYIQAYANNIQNYYLYQTEYLNIFPRDMMVEGSIEGQGSMGTIHVSCHDIIVSESADPYDYDTFKGNPVSGKDFNISIKETYYERVFVEQKYNAIYKTQYNVYKNIKHESIVYTGSAITDEKGQAQVEYDGFIDGRFYTATLTTKDGQDRTISEAAYYYTSKWYQPYDVNEEGFRLDVRGQASGEENWWYSSYDLNESLSLELLFNGQSIESDIDKLLIVEERDGINHYHMTEDSLINIVMDESRMPDTHLKAIYYNGSFMFNNWNMERYILVDYSSLELDLSVSFDKEAYRPGETVNYQVTCLDRDGNPTSAGVNVSVVDEAIFDIIEDDDDPLREMYQGDYNPNIIASFLLTPITDSPNMAEKGGEGGGEAFRDDFQDTTYFQNIMVDQSGIYNGSFLLPDNITSWRVTLTGYDGRLLCDKKVANVSSGLPFFVDLMSEERYLEGDDIGISMKSAGDLSLLGKSATYKMVLFDGQGNQVQEETIEAEFGERVQIQLGKLPLDDYMIEASVSVDEHWDGVRLPMEVTDHIANYDMVIEEALSDDLTITHNENVSSLSIYNEEARIFYNTLSSLASWRRDDHNGRRIVGILADWYKADLFGDDTDRNLVNIPSVNGIIKPLNAAGVDAVLTARLMAIGYGDCVDTYIYDRLIETLTKQKDLGYGWEKVINENVMSYIWMAVEAGIESPDIYDEIVKEWDRITSLEAKMILLRGCLDAGKYSRAEQILQFIAYEEDFSKDQLPIVYSADKETDEMMQFNMLAVMIEMGRMEDAKRIYDHITYWNYKRNLQFRIDDPEKFMYMTMIEPPELESLFVYQLNGVQTSATIGFRDRVELVMTAEEAKTFKLIEYTGDLVAVREYVGFADDVAGQEVSVTKTYKNAKGGLIHVGDEVVVELVITNLGGSKYFTIQDVLPAGLAFVKVLDDPTSTYLYGDSIGQMVDLRGGATWNYRSASSLTFRYLAKATSQGTYKSEPCVFARRWEGKIWIGEETWVTIEE